MGTQSLEELIRELPPELRQEVETFVQFLIEKKLSKPRNAPRLTWAGALKELRGQYTSVDLQHRISDWRSEEH